MQLTDAVYNAMLDNQFPAGAGNILLSTHSAYSVTGANLLGTKTSANFAAASGRTKGLAANTSIAVAAASTVRWLGAWDSTGVTFKGMQPNGAADKTFQVDVLNNQIECENHNYAANDTIVFYGDAAPAPLVVGTTYFAVTITAGDPDTFQVAATSGGAAIDITGQAGAGCVVSRIIEEPYVGSGNHIVSAYNLSL